MVFGCAAHPQTKMKAAVMTFFYWLSAAGSFFFFFFPQRCCYNSPKIIITSSDPRFAPKCKWNLLQNSNCCYWMCKAALDIVKINLYSSRNFNIRPSWLNGGRFLAWIHSGFTVNVDPTTTYEKKRYLTCYYCFHVLPKGTSMMNYQ